MSSLLSTLVSSLVIANTQAANHMAENLCVSISRHIQANLLEFRLSITVTTKGDLGDFECNTVDRVTWACPPLITSKLCGRCGGDHGCTADKSAATA